MGEVPRKVLPQGYHREGYHGRGTIGTIGKAVPIIRRGITGVVLLGGVPRAGEGGGVLREGYRL